MRMSTKGRYGLRLMIELASQYGRGPVLAETIASRQGISGKYLHVLAVGLRNAGLLRTVRGPSGGYQLTRKPSSVTALEVITALEGKIAPVSCTLTSSSCSRSMGCAARDLWCRVAAAVDAVLSGVTLAQLVDTGVNRYARYPAQGQIRGRAGVAAVKVTVESSSKQHLPTAAVLPRASLGRSRTSSRAIRPAR